MYIFQQRHVVYEYYVDAAIMLMQRGPYVALYTLYVNIHTNINMYICQQRNVVNEDYVDAAM